MSVPAGDARTLRDELRRVAASDRLLVALDFDGTLAPLQDEPMRARMLPEAAAAVSALARAPRTCVAFVSGRTLHDLRIIAEHTEDSPILLAGSHGAEFWIPGEGERGPDDDADGRALRDEMRTAAESVIGAAEGAWIEPKTFGFAVHTRLTDAATAARVNDAVDALVAERAPHWRRRTGRDIVEYALRDEGKDAAVAVLREVAGADAVVFAGDDLTDEDALEHLRRQDLGVLVGERDSAARVRVAGIPELAAALVVLAGERAARPS
ncbi:trehalose-phosphatase [Microbacterium sp. BWT-B31]|uniref:trehalose-phosphatase n=1 Tax=Microbacterium sp. BWT-B31 TaxID=3232072 RepID=UPI003528F225